VRADGIGDRRPAESGSPSTPALRSRRKRALIVEWCFGLTGVSPTPSETLVELVRGQVSDRPWGQTLGALGLRQLTGQLTLTAADRRQYSIAFERGAIVGATSPLANDSAVRVALTSQLITPPQASRIAREPTERGDDLERVIASCQLDPGQALRLRQRVIAQCAARTFAVEAGEFVVEDAITIATTLAAAVDVRAIVCMGARMNLSDERLIRELRQMGSHFTLKATAINDLPQFGLSESDRPIFEALRQGTTIAEVEARCREFDRRRIESIVYALVACFACDAITVPTVRPSRESATPAPPARTVTPILRTTTVAPPARAATPTAPIPARTATPTAPFPARTATPTAPIPARTTTPPPARTTTPPPARTTTPPPTRLPSESIHPAASRRSHSAEPLPRQISTSQTPPLQRPASASQALPAQPRASSSQPLSTQQPASESSQRIGRASSSQPIPIQSRTTTGRDSLAEAAEAYARGQAALRDQKITLAIAELTCATELNPHEFDYHAVLAWAQFCGSRDRAKMADKVRKMLGRAIQKSQTPELALFYLGRMERMLGRERDALKIFKQVIKADPYHLEAQLEIEAIQAKLAAGSAEKPGLASLFRKKT
jgi:hypothetical protein